jgi:steroid 5-alpha reductase family enzyme
VRRALIAAMAAVWSLRLGTHLLVRIARKHPEEDGRYRQLRKDWGRAFRPRWRASSSCRPLSVVLLGDPVPRGLRESPRRGSPLEWAGAALWLVAISGEALADAQLAAFKRDRKNAGKVCDAGLWRYSRHPNYFFEWLIWVSYFVFACASPWGWAGILSPACILFLLLRVTGIPATEEQSVRSKGDAYRRYQETDERLRPAPDPHRPP